ncbi:MAG: addiction module protein [Flavobacteriales bacterium]|nr:addiction module protein [Flavobacteriales bacterium]
MSNTITIQDLLKLSVAERILLIEKLWDSINPQDIELSEAHKKELDKRLDRYLKGETRFFSWEEVKRDLHSGK